MSNQKEIQVSISTTEAGWKHIIQLIESDIHPGWHEFNSVFIQIIQNTINKRVQLQSNVSQVTDESKHYHLGDDGQYHHEEYFAEEYGSYANYQSLSDDASDMGFPDAESYQNWLDD